jgi:gluconolactonase
LGPDGAIYICNLGGFDHEKFVSKEGPGNEGRIERVDLSSGKVERLYDRCDDHMLQGADDLVFDRAGNFWFTDYGKDLEDRRVFGGLYYASPSGGMIKRGYAPGLSFNGVVLSPDEKRLYVADTYSARVWRLDLDSPGCARKMSFPDHPGELHATIPLGGKVDSMAMLASGSICVGMIRPGGVAVVAPSGAAQCHLMPESVVTNLAFGGKDMRDAYITFSGGGRLMKCRWPEPGLRLNFCNY